MAKLKIAKDLFDLLYPVGTYYETSNANWTPSSAGWYGTWVEDTGGRVTVALDTGQTSFEYVGKTGGSETHKHWTAFFDFNDGLAILDTARINKRFGWTNPPQDAGNWWFNKSGTTNSTSGGSQHGVTTESSLQPYIVVRRWHRTA